MFRLLRSSLRHSSFNIPAYRNEPMLQYAPGSTERKLLQKALSEMKERREVIPVVIGGREYFTTTTVPQVMPTSHGHVLADVHQADAALIEKAISVSVQARQQWNKTPFEDRAAVFLKAADLISTKYRYKLMAATMLGQGKTVWQAEIDAAAESIDFLRFNVKGAEELITNQQPNLHSNTTWNRLVYRALEGFVAAISPFNFTAIGVNLATSPAIMGNSVIWKPSHTSSLSNYLVFKILQESGLPDGVINFVASDGPLFGNIITNSQYLAAINFTGSTKTFNHLWQQVGNQIGNYKSYPRMIGECGGKNFHLVHHSADIQTVINETIRSSFEYQGQKCSACSRLYVPTSIWNKIRSGLVDALANIKQGQPDDFESFLTAVIDRPAYTRIVTAIKNAKANKQNTIIAGGNYDDSVGYFISPTIIHTTDPSDYLLQTELFGPVLTVIEYADTEGAWLNVLDVINTTSPYALTGAVFATDRYEIRRAFDKLGDAAGNFYINCKSTGAIVGQQPFGGSRSSGTNDKAGATSYLVRLSSLQSVKESFVPVTDWKYPSMLPNI